MKFKAVNKLLFISSLLSLAPLSFAADSTFIIPPSTLKPAQAALDLSEPEIYMGNSLAGSVEIKCPDGTIATYYAGSKRPDNDSFVAACATPKIIYK